MIFNIYLLCFIVLFFGTINALPVYRYRRQINSPKNSDPYDRPSARISGSIVGTYYYGIGSDPNYGSFIHRPDTSNSGGILPISYNPDSNLFSNLIQPSYLQLPQQQQGYLYNTNNAWQGQNMNNYNSPFYNRYPPGSQGWYATGGNYWYNNGKSIIAHPYLLMISTVLLILCK